MRRVIIVVKATDRDGANVVCQAGGLDPVGGARTFTVGLHPSGNPNPPPSHYWCDWVVTDEQWATLWAEFGDRNGKRQSRMFDAATWTPDAVLAEMGLQRSTREA